MKHLPDLLTLRHRHPLFHSSVRRSVCPSVNSSVMSKFDIYIKVSILINYKTKQLSNLAWNISLTFWFCNKGICFSVRPSVCLSIRLSTFMSKFDIYVKVSILINYNSTTTIIRCITHLPDLLSCQVHWPGGLDLYLTLQWLTQFTLRFQIFSTIRPTTTKPCIVLLLDDSAGTLTQWPWPIFCAPVTSTHFASTFDISSTIRPATIKPCKVFLFNVLTRQIPWPGDLDLYFGWRDFDII